MAINQGRTWFLTCSGQSTGELARELNKIAETRKIIKWELITQDWNENGKLHAIVEVTSFDLWEPIG